MTSGAKDEGSERNLAVLIVMIVQPPPVVEQVWPLGLQPFVRAGVPGNGVEWLNATMKSCAVFWKTESAIRKLSSVSVS